MFQASAVAAIPPTAPDGAATPPESRVSSSALRAEPAQAMYPNNGPLEGAPQEQANRVNQYENMAEKAKQRRNQRRQLRQPQSGVSRISGNFKGFQGSIICP